MNVLFVLLSVLTASSFAQEPRLYTLKPQYAFTPKGFDSNDNAQVVLAGAFSDYCMQVGPTEKRIDEENKKIYIRQSYTTMNDCNDIEMYIPYSVEVNLGHLSKGNYEVYVYDLDQKYTLMSHLPVQEAKSTVADERIYAQVTGIEFKPTGGPAAQLTIRGVFTNTCLEMQKIIVNAREGDVFEVLPAASVLKNTECMATFQTFSKTVDLPGFSQRDTLIHVRSMNGQSINKVITTLDRLN